MKAKEGLAGKYPLVNAFGRDHVFLSDDQAGEADVSTRIKSIWPFVVRMVRSFHGKMSPRERIAFDVDDMISEVWIGLAERDRFWKPEKGRYLTFAGTAIRAILVDMLDRATTIHKPKDSSRRMRIFDRDHADGTASSKRAKTAADIRRAGTGGRSLDESSAKDFLVESDPLEQIIAREDSEAENAKVVKAVSSLTPIEAMVVGKLYGLWGRRPESIWYTRWMTGMPSIDAVRRSRDTALRKIATIIQEEDPLAG